MFLHVGNGGEGGARMGERSLLKAKPMFQNPYSSLVVTLRLQAPSYPNHDDTWPYYTAYIISLIIGPRNLILLGCGRASTNAKKIFETIPLEYFPQNDSRNT